MSARPLCVAHRGLWRTHDENTIPAFRAAIDAGCDMLELDVHETADGRLIVFHDDAWSPQHPPWTALPYAAVRDLAQGTERAPPFEDVLAAVGPVPLDIEVKTLRDAPAFVRFLAAHPPAPGSFVSSGTWSTLAQLRVAALPWPLWPVVSIGRERSFADNARNALVCRAPWAPPAWLAGIAIHDALLTAPLVARMHAHGRAVQVWTVNDPERWDELTAWGVDGIITNDVDRLVERTRRRKP